MEKDFPRKNQLWKVFHRIRNQISAHAQKSVEAPLRKRFNRLANKVPSFTFPYNYFKLLSYCYKYDYRRL